MNIDMFEPICRFNNVPTYLIHVLFAILQCPSACLLNIAPSRCHISDEDMASDEDIPASVQ